MNKYEALRAQGLVVEGNYSDVDSVNVSCQGESHPMAVNSEFVEAKNETVLWPLGTEKQPADESDDPRVVAANAARAWRQSSIGHVETVIGSTHKEPIPMVEGRSNSV